MSASFAAINTGSLKTATFEADAITCDFITVTGDASVNAFLTAGEIDTGVVRTTNCFVAGHNLNSFSNQTLKFAGNITNANNLFDVPAHFQRIGPIVYVTFENANVDHFNLAAGGNTFIVNTDLTLITAANRPAAPYTFPVCILAGGNPFGCYFYVNPDGTYGIRTLDDASFANTDVRVTLPCISYVGV
jgi:hypothetical protein